MRRLVFVLAWCAVVSADCQERVLLPVAYTGPGAYEAFWQTRVFARNRSAVPVAIPGYEFNVACTLPTGCTFPSLPPGVVGEVAQPGGEPIQAPHGLLFGLPAGVDLSARVGAFPRLNRGGGTDLPLPPEADFQTSLFFPAVPLRETSQRVLLRLYALDVTESVPVRILYRRRWSAPLPPLMEVTRFLQGGSSDRPAYAEVVLDEPIPAGPSSAADIEVISDVAVKIWGVISVTDAVANEVSLIVPMK